MEASDKELLFLDIFIKKTLTKYGWIFLLSQRTLGGVSHSRFI